MDSLILLSWLAYWVCGLLLLLATWKLLRPLPFSLKVSIFLSQLALLLVPASVSDSALAPAFIVIILEILTGEETAVWLEKALPLVLAVIAAWPLGFLLGWIRNKWQAKQLSEQDQDDKNPEAQE